MADVFIGTTEKIVHTVGPVPHRKSGNLGTGRVASGGSPTGYTPGGHLNVPGPDAAHPLSGD